MWKSVIRGLSRRMLEKSAMKSQTCALYNYMGGGWANRGGLEALPGLVWHLEFLSVLLFFSPPTVTVT